MTSRQREPPLLSDLPVLPYCLSYEKETKKTSRRRYQQSWRRRSSRSAARKGWGRPKSIRNRTTDKRRAPRHKTYEANNRAPCATPTNISALVNVTLYIIQSKDSSFRGHIMLKECSSCGGVRLLYLQTSGGVVGVAADADDAGKACR